MARPNDPHMAVLMDVEGPFAESQQAVIQQVTFTRMTPPDKRFDGFGGVINITIRTV